MDTSRTASLENLNCLMSDCRLVLSDRSKASDVLPCEEGFFFGSQVYDDYYFENLAETERMLAQVISDTTDDDELFYHAWW